MNGKKIPNFNDLNDKDKEEYTTAMNYASAQLLLRVWQEASQKFLHYLKNSPHSPFRKVRCMFSRCEWQKMVGNLHHLHLMLEVALNLLSAEERTFIDDLCRCSIFDIVRVNEVDDLINDGTFESKEDYYDVVSDGNDFLGHICNSRCVVKTGDGKFRCRKLNYLEVTKDNTKHTFQEFNNHIPKDCLDTLIQIGMVEPIEMNVHGYVKK